MTCHRLLVDLLEEQELEEELIEALDKASQSFPYVDFCIKYAEAINNKDENLDDSFGSGDDEDEEMSARTELHAKMLAKLVHYLDFKPNMNDARKMSRSRGQELGQLAVLASDWLFTLV